MVGLGGGGWGGAKQAGEGRARTWSSGPGCPQGVGAMQPGAGLSPEWAREEAEAVPEALAAMGGGVWEGDAPPSPRGKLRRPGPAPGRLRGNMALFGPIPACAALTGGVARQTQCLLWEASVGGRGCQGEGPRPSCWEAHTEEETCSLLGGCDPRGMWLPVGLPGARGDIVPLLGSSVSAGA